MLRTFVLIVVLCLFWPMNISASPPQSGEVVTTPWVCRDYVFGQLEVCHKQPYSRIEAVVQLLHPVTTKQNVFKRVIIVTLMGPNKDPEILVLNNVSGVLWKVKVLGTRTTRWAAGEYEAFALIP